MRAADRAVGILPQLKIAEVHAERVDQQKTTDERLANTEDQLDGLGGLDDADKPRQNAEDAALRAGRHEARRWRLRIQAAIARAFGQAEDAGLTLKAEDGAVGVGLAEQNAGIVDEVTRLKVVGAVRDHVEVLEDLHRVRAGEHGIELDDLEVRVQVLQFLLSGVDLEHADGRGGVDDLPLQIARIDHVEVHQTDGAHAGRGEVVRQRRAEAACPDAQDLGGFKLPLALHADLGKDQVARVARDLLVRERWQLRNVCNSFGFRKGCGGHGYSCLCLVLRDLRGRGRCAGGTALQAAGSPGRAR